MIGRKIQHDRNSIRVSEVKALQKTESKVEHEVCYMFLKFMM